MEECTAYIDESGDLGINKGTHWFVLSAVIVDKADEPNIRAKISQIRNQLNMREIHFKKIPDFNRRAFITRELNSEKFTYMNILVDTRKFDAAKIPSPLIAYNYICKYLLQRVSWFMEDTGRIGDIVLSARGTSRDNELIQYIQDKLLPYPANQINGSVFGKTTAKTAGMAYEENKYGFCTPCFSYAMQDHLYRRNGKVKSYGIKFFTSDMAPDIKELRAKRVCAQKERTPGATTT